MPEINDSLLGLPRRRMTGCCHAWLCLYQTTHIPDMRHHHHKESAFPVSYQRVAFSLLRCFMPWRDSLPPHGQNIIRYIIFGRQVYSLLQREASRTMFASEFQVSGACVMRWLSIAAISWCHPELPCICMALVGSCQRRRSRKPAAAATACIVLLQPLIHRPQ